MQSAVAMKPIQQAAEPQIVAMNAACEQMNNLPETIAQRAFEIFESRGQTDGRDLEDWFRAEAEPLTASFGRCGFLWKWTRQGRRQR
jgi:hypothetical protein